METVNINGKDYSLATKTDCLLSESCFFNGAWYVPKKEQPKDWEILSFKSSLGYISNLDSDGLYKYPTHGAWTLDIMMKSNEAINSVKRLSDGEVFTLGEITQAGSEIIEFKLYDHSMFVRLTDKNNRWETSLASLIKVKKKPLWFTEDVVPIYEKDTFPVYKVDKDNCNILMFAACDAANWEGYKYFASEEKAKEYAQEELFNKPLLSLNDIVGCYLALYKTNTKREDVLSSPAFQQFKAHAENKLNAK